MGETLAVDILIMFHGWEVSIRVNHLFLKFWALCLSFHISEIVFNYTSSLGKYFTHIAKATCAKLIAWRRISIILQNVKPCWLQIIEQSNNLGSFRRIGDPTSKNYKTPSVSWQPHSWESWKFITEKENNSMHVEDTSVYFIVVGIDVDLVMLENHVKRIGVVFFNTAEERGLV